MTSNTSLYWNTGVEEVDGVRRLVETIPYVFYGVDAALKFGFDHASQEIPFPDMRAGSKIELLKIELPFDADTYSEMLAEGHYEEVGLPVLEDIGVLECIARDEKSPDLIVFQLRYRDLGVSSSVHDSVIEVIFLPLDHLSLVRSVTSSTGVRETMPIPFQKLWDWKRWLISRQPNYDGNGDSWKIEDYLLLPSRALEPALKALTEETIVDHCPGPEQLSTVLKEMVAEDEVFRLVSFCTRYFIIGKYKKGT